MKKLMIAALAIAFGAVAQAATVTWSVTGIQTTGDFDTGDGDYATGYMVYLFSDAVVSQSAMASAIAADTGWSDLLGSAMHNQVATGDEGSIYKGGLTTSDGPFNGYLVIFDAATAADASNAFVTDIYTVPDNAMHKISFDEFDGDGYVNAIGTWSAVNVPEPTSGLLLLLGMAGIALRRKQA